MHVTLLLVEQHTHLQSHASGPAVFLVFCDTHYSLEYPTSKSLVVLSQEIGVSTPHTLSVLLLFQENKH